MNGTARLETEWLFAVPGSRPPLHRAALDIVDGRIAAITENAQGGRGRAAMPALVNAHDHGRGLRSVAFGAFDQPLEAWVASLRLVPGVDLYTNCVVAFGRLALSGVSAISHVHIPGGGDTVEEAMAVARAARDVGVRVAYALPVVDANAFVYGGPSRFCSCHNPVDWAVAQGWDGRPETAMAQMERVDAVASACQSPIFTVQYGPAGPQWVTEAGLRNLAERSAADGRRIHMHLLESTTQRQWSDRHYPGGLLAHLDALGLLSPALTVAHCVWLTDAEIDLLAARGATAVVNTSSNLRLSSGVAPVRRFANRGLRFAFGLDGLAFNDDEDALFELRLMSSLHGPRGFADPGVDRSAMWRAATADGRFTIDGHEDTGRLDAGADADIMVIDVAALAADGVAELCDPLDLIMTRAARRHVSDLYVAGRHVVSDHRLTGVDLDAAERELVAEARAAAGTSIAEAPLMRRHLAAIGAYYRDGRHLEGRD